MNLVIVESPTKAHTIEKYLGPGYVVKASVGHLIDLPKSRMAIDIENGFQPEYITVRGRAKLLKELQKDAKKSDRTPKKALNDIGIVTNKIFFIIEVHSFKSTSFCSLC